MSKEGGRAMKSRQRGQAPESKSLWELCSSNGFSGNAWVMRSERHAKKVTSLIEQGFSARIKAAGQNIAVSVLVMNNITYLVLLWFGGLTYELLGLIVEIQKLIVSKKGKHCQDPDTEQRLLQDAKAEWLSQDIGL